MTRYILPAVGAAILSLGALMTPAAAAPAAPAHVIAAASGLTQVRYHRHHRHYRRYRRHGGYARSSDNSRDPSRPGYQQNKGNTTGGYR